LTTWNGSKPIRGSPTVALAAVSNGPCKSMEMDSTRDRIAFPSPCRAACALAVVLPSTISSTAAKATVGETRIVFDPFHVVKLANEAMEQVRREEIAIHQRLDDPKGVAILKKARYSLLTAATRQKEWARSKVSFIGNWFANTAEAYRLKEVLRLYRQCTSEVEACVHLDQWIAMAKSSPLAPMRTLAKSIEKRKEGIVRVFRLGVTNAAAESLNARIQAVRVKSRGHRHFQAFRNSVLFHLGALDLYPRNPHSAPCPVSG